MSLGNNSLNFYSVPKLQNDGTNWITYKTRLRTVIGAKGLMRHLDGTAQQPSLPANPSAAAQPKTDPLSVLIAPEASGSASKGKGKDVKPSEVELDAFEKALEKLEEWEQKQYIVKQQIFLTITDSLLLRVQALHHAHEVWNTVCREFEAKTMMVQIDLRCRLQDTRCDDSTDIRTHFDGLLRMKEELSGMGTTLQDVDFSAIIMSSLPKSFDPVLSSMLSAARISNKSLDPHTIIAHITEEYDRRSIQARLEKKASDGTALLTAGDAKKKRSRGNGKKDGTKCPNCGKGYHTVANCWSKGGGKEGQGPERKGGGSGKESWD